MKKQNIQSAVLCFFLLLTFSCKREVEVAPEMGYDYFPTKIGQWVIYDVDSIFYDSFKQFAFHYHYQIKEIIESDFLDNSGKTTQRIERYRRDNDSMPWIIKNVWYANRTATTAEKVEINNRFIKLIFPLKADKIWNGNSYNTIGSWDYQYTDINTFATIGNLYFDSTVTVTQTGYNDPIINTQLGKEVYAKHVGMIYREYTNLEIKIDTGSNRDTSGVSYRMTVIDYAK